jgi:hypothetical protein
MNARLAALLLLLGAFGLALQWSAPRRDPRNLPSPAALLPPVAGDYRMVSSSSNALGSVSERAASYAGPAGAVQVSMRVGAMTGHSAVACYLGRGEPLLWEKLHKVNAAGTMATFDVALFEDGPHLRLVASTSCSSKSCDQTVLRDWKSQWLNFDLHSLFLVQPVVPVNIMLSGETGAAGSQAAQAALLGAFESFAGRFDLRPALELAAGQ